MERWNTFVIFCNADEPFGDAPTVLANVKNELGDLLRFSISYLYY
jgi:hypothetical protein